MNLSSERGQLPPPLMREPAEGVPKANGPSRDDTPAKLVRLSRELGLDTTLWGQHLACQLPPPVDRLPNPDPMG